MNILFVIIECIAFLALFSCRLPTVGPPAGKGKIKIEWIHNLTGDFSFAEKWSYPENVYRNEYDQLSCDGLCPPEIETMRDSTGRIYDDSLKAFYRLVDTMHLAHGIQCEGWCYEWDGTDLITARRKSDGTVECFSGCNASTHSILHFIIANDICSPAITLNSIASAQTKTYPCMDGYFKIDRGLFKDGTLKAEFDLNFENKENTRQKMFLKGRIYSNFRR
jgi:hypothetical protein